MFDTIRVYTICNLFFYVDSDLYQMGVMNQDGKKPYKHDLGWYHSLNALFTGQDEKMKYLVNLVVIYVKAAMLEIPATMRNDEIGGHSVGLTLSDSGHNLRLPIQTEKKRLPQFCLVAAMATKGTRLPHDVALITDIVNHATLTFYGSNNLCQSDLQHKHTIDKFWKWSFEGIRTVQCIFCISVC